MSRRRAISVALVALATIALEILLVRVMAHGHVAHVLLGSGNSAPPLGAALLAVSLVVVRFAAVVIAPGALLAALASVVAHVVVGPLEPPPAPRGARDGRAHGDGAGRGTSSGTGMRPEGKGSADGEASAGTGINIEGLGTK